MEIDYSGNLSSFFFDGNVHSVYIWMDCYVDSSRYHLQVLQRRAARTSQVFFV